MIVLAIDTCEARGSVAVLNGDMMLHVVAHASAEEYSSWLLPAVALALQSAKSTLDEVDVFAVASGPGSFTGVRIGLTTVKARPQWRYNGPQNATKDSVGMFFAVFISATVSIWASRPIAPSVFSAASA